MLIQKESSRGVLKKSCSENMQQTYRRTPIPKYDFNKVAKQSIEITRRHGCSPVYLLHIFRTRFPKSISGELLLLILTNPVEWAFSAPVDDYAWRGWGSPVDPSPKI